MEWRATAEGACHLVNEARADQGDPVSLRPAASRREPMCLRIRSLPDPMLSSLNSPLFGILNSGQLWTLLLLAKVVFGIRQDNQSSHSALKSQGSRRRASRLLRKREHHAFALRKKSTRGGSGSGPEDNNLDFHRSNRMSAMAFDKRIVPTMDRQR
jgi:hypothetical protein